MTGVHETFALVALGLNVLAAGWGGYCWSNGIPSTVFWYLLRAAQLSVAVQVVLGLILLAQGHQVPDDLHYIYAITPLIVAVVCEFLRAGASQSELELVDDPDALPRRDRILLARRIVLREIGILTVGLLLNVSLLLRAAQIF
jgi:hypothetical protein